MSLENEVASTTTTPLPESPIVDAATVISPAVAPETPVSTPLVEAPAPEVSTEKIVSHTDTPTLMETFTPTEEVVAEPAIVEPQMIEPVAYEFQLPDGVQPNDDQINSYKEILGKHAVAPEVGQELIDMHAGAMQRYAEHMAEQQHRVFADTRSQWRNAVLSDDEIGGAGHQTAMNTIFRMRDLFVPERDRDGFNDFLRVTGAGDHPAFLRLLHRVGKLFDEGRPAPMPASPAPQPNEGRRLGAIYDHPSSRKGR